MTLARKLRPTVWILAAVLTAAVLFCGCSSRATLPQLPSDAKPEEVVARFLEALQEKDEAAKKAVLTVEKQNLAPEPYIHGIEIHELYERLDEDAQQWKEKIVTQSEKAISMGIKTEQIAIVYADFTVEAEEEPAEKTIFEKIIDFFKSVINFLRNALNKVLSLIGITL